jgi:hypothetical protein
MGSHQIEKILHIEGNNSQNEETACRMGENLFQIFYGDLHVG